MPSERLSGPPARPVAVPDGLADAMRRLQRRIAHRLALRICRVRRVNGRWSVLVEVAVPSAAADGTVWCRRRDGRAVGDATTLPLAVAAAVAELAVQSGFGLALFAVRPLRRRTGWPR